MNQVVTRYTSGIAQGKILIQANTNPTFSGFCTSSRCIGPSPPQPQYFVKQAIKVIETAIIIAIPIISKIQVLAKPFLLLSIIDTFSPNLVLAAFSVLFVFVKRSKLIFSCDAFSIIFASTSNLTSGGVVCCG